MLGECYSTQNRIWERVWEFNERQTKTRDGSHCHDVRPLTPKMFPIDESEKDPLVVYKTFAERRPQQMINGDSPFYLVIKKLKLKSLGTKNWFKANAVGIKQNQ